MHHVFTHSFDYIALGILIACMLFAATKAIPRRTRWNRRGTKHARRTDERPL